jgi:DNA-binding response OmpR family regulator
MYNILIVDDSTDLVDMVTHLYARRNFIITSAASKDDLRLVLERIKPDLILLDVILESSDGRTLCKELKSTDPYKDIPIILMSGDHERLQNYREVFADDILEKPFIAETILLKVKALLGK